MTKVYICMPYGDHNTHATRQRNVDAAMEVWHDLADHGLQPYCPHLSHYLHEWQGRDRQQWLNQSKAWLGVCDCVLAIGLESDGMAIELTLAMQLGIPVFRSVQAVAEAYQRTT